MYAILLPLVFIISASDDIGQYKWGSTAAVSSALSATGVSEGDHSIHEMSPNLKFGKNKADSLSLGFYNDRLYQISISFKKRNRESVANEATTRWGTPKREREGILAWRTQTIFAEMPDEWDRVEINYLPIYSERAVFMRKEYGEFRGVPWGADLAKVPGMAITKTTDEGSEFYARSSDDLKIGRVALVGIRYRSYKGKFYEVHITAQGAESFRDLMAILDSRYSDSYRRNQFMDRYEWNKRDDSLNLAVGVLLNYSSITDLVDVFISEKNLQLDILTKEKPKDAVDASKGDF